MPANIHLLNATGVLNSRTPDITSAFRTATFRAKKFLHLKDADIVVGNNSNYAIPELGIGGYTDSVSKVIYLSLDQNVAVTVHAIEACLDHEYYHLARHQRIGVPVTLRDRMIDEGLACLYEKETTGEVPIYAQQDIARMYLNLFKRHTKDEKNTDRWFFGGEKIPKWFAYSLGFKLVSQYGDQFNTTAVQMLDLNGGKLYATIMESLRSVSD